MRTHTRSIVQFVLTASSLFTIHGVAFAGSPGSGAVYTQTNAPEGNAVTVFNRAANGALTLAGEVATGGIGTGSGLGDQGALALSSDRRFLLTVNAGSDDLSVFAVDKEQLELVDVAPSGGDMPVSVTVSGDLVYVLNAGGEGNISGFYLGADGGLEPIPGSSRPLSGAGTAPAQVQFSPDGRVLAVTERATNRIVTYVVDYEGLTTGPLVHTAPGQTPFGFSFRGNDVLVVAEAFAGQAGASAVSSFHVAPDGALSVIDASVPTHQTAACWLALTGNGKYAYTTNAGSGTVSGYAVAPDGSIELLDEDGITGATGENSGPTDVAVSHNGRFLYVLKSA